MEDLIAYLYPYNDGNYDGSKTLCDLFQHSGKGRHYEAVEAVNQLLRLRTTTTRKKTKNRHPTSTSRAFS